MRIYRASQTPQETASAAPAVATHDMAVLKRHFQFIRDEEADLVHGAGDWQVRMSVRYYRKLFREYALADLSRYKESKVGLRWRTEMEVVAGKGQFVCGNKACDARQELHSYELLFAYEEHGERKKCLVKVRVCEACARKLFYRKIKEAEKRGKKEERKEERKRRRREEGEEEEEERVEGKIVRGKKKKRRRLTKEDEEEDGARGVDASVHALCAEINAADMRKLRGDGSKREETKASEDDEEAKQLKELLL